MSPQFLLLEGLLKKSALSGKGRNLSVLTKLKNSLGTNLNQFSKLIFEQTTNAQHKDNFSSHRQILHDSQDTELLPYLVVVHGLTFIMTSNDSFSWHLLHIAHVFSMHVCFFSLKWCCMIFMLSASGMSLSNELSSLLLKVSHLVARYTVPFICMFY